MKSSQIIKSLENTLVKQKKLAEYNWIFFTLINTALALALSLFQPKAIEVTTADCFITTFLSCTISVVGLNQYTKDLNKLEKIRALKIPTIAESKKKIRELYSQIKIAYRIVKLGRLVIISAYGITIVTIALEQANLMHYNSAHNLILINYVTAIFFNLYIAISLQIDREYKILSWYRKTAASN